MTDISLSTGTSPTTKRINRDYWCHLSLVIPEPFCFSHCMVTRSLWLSQHNDTHHPCIHASAISMCTAWINSSMTSPTTSIAWHESIDHFLPVTIIMFITATPRVSLTFELTFKFSYPLLVLYIINIYQIMTQNTHRHGLFNLSRNACSKIWQGLSKANCRVVSVIWSKQMVVYGGTAQ